MILWHELVPTEPTLCVSYLFFWGGIRRQHIHMDSDDEGKQDLLVPFSLGLVGAFIFP